MSVDRREVDFGWVVDNGEKGGPQDGSCKIYSVRHGKGVKIEHLGFSPNMMSPSAHDETNHGPDHGTLCMITTGGKDMYGTPMPSIIGIVPNSHKDGAMPGNEFLNRSLPAIKKAYEDERGVRTPPKTKETMKDGVKIRQVQESGKKHSIKLLNGIPSHGALYPMVGMVLPQVQNIATAVQSFNAILTPDILGKLPGLSMSLGGMFDMLKGKLMDELMEKLPKDLVAGFQNMQTLIQSVEVNEGGGFSVAGKVDPTTFLTNAVGVLSSSSDLGSLVGNFQRLQTDTSLFGLDKLTAGLNLEIDGPFGKIGIGIDASGAIQNLIPEPIQKAMDAFQSMLGQASMFPGVDPAKPMFGESGAVLSSMMSRMPTAMQTSATQMFQQAIAGGSPARAALNLVENATNNGIDIMAQIKFK